MSARAMQPDMATVLRRAVNHGPIGVVRSAFAGMMAIGVKELRGRMRGRRAFVIVTAYLLVLAGFAWMMALILEREYAAALGGSAAFASAQIGRGVFGALMILQTVLVIVLAPAFTTGAISLEREKQTLDMLAATPISSLALVVGKLFSALTYVFILIFASIPLTAIVFVFGGVGPEHVVRGYLILLAAALGLGAVGLFFSALIQRTQAATIGAYFAIAAVTAGTFFVAYFWNAMTGAGQVTDGTREFGPLTGRPPEALQYLNPYFAQADVLCSVEEGFGEWCNRLAFVGARASTLVIPVPLKGQPGAGVDPGGVVTDPGVVVTDRGIVDDEVRGDGVVAGPEPVSVANDAFWPKTTASWLVLSAVFLIASIQLVSPTRRWRLILPLPGRPARPSGRSSP